MMINQVLLNARANDATRPFIHDADKITGPKRSIKITDRFTCTSANVIYCITCTLCKKIYIGETGRRLGDRFREHLRDVERNDKDASKPVARHFNLPNHPVISCYFVRIVNERTSVASFARAFKSTWLMIRFKYTSN